MDKPHRPYRDALEGLAATRPRITAKLREAEDRRTERLATYLDGRRLAGLEQLYAYVDRLEAAYEADDALRALSFLIRRAARDFETALEATLSAYQGVAADAMRDVMEIEQLLLDFATHEGHAQEWLECDRPLRLKKYSPAALRKRLVAAGVPPFSDDGWEPTDPYRSHSESLHVTPNVPVVGARGLESQPDSLLADAGFIEIFEHAWRFLRAAEMLRHVQAGHGPEGFELLLPMDDFFDAKGRTGEMLVIMTAALGGPGQL